MYKYRSLSESESFLMVHCSNLGDTNITLFTSNFAAINKAVTPTSCNLDFCTLCFVNKYLST